MRLGLLDVAPDARVVVVPVADGGEGTVAAALAAGWSGVPVEVHGPTGEPVTTTLALAGDRGRSRAATVLVELADACGLGRLPGGVPAPLTASSRGLGEALRAALDLGADEVVVGVGGSASTDGGAGMLAALGARLLDAYGHDLPDGGAALADLARLDLSGLDPRLAATDLVLAADVDNPLLGPTGAAAVYAPQKGASPDDVASLEAALTHWADVVADALPLPAPGTRSTNRSKLPQPAGNPSRTRSTYWSILSRPGAGAAGGVGFALLAVLGAERRSGVDVVLDLVGLDDALSDASAASGARRPGRHRGGRARRADPRGQGRRGVARRARAHGIPVVAVCGRCALDDARPGQPSACTRPTRWPTSNPTPIGRSRTPRPCCAAPGSASHGSGSAAHRRDRPGALEHREHVRHGEVGHRRARLDRRRAHVRQEHHVVTAQQPGVHARLVLEDVEPGAGDLAGLERCHQRRLVDDRAAGGVDQVRRWAASPALGGADQVARRRGERAVFNMCSIRPFVCLYFTDFGEYILRDKHTYHRDTRDNHRCNGCLCGSLS